MDKFKKRELVKKIIDCRNKIRKDCNCSNSYYDLGSAYWELGLHKEAIDAFKQVERINPGIDIVNDFLGRLYSLVGDHKEAIIAFNKVLRISPHNEYFVSVHCNLIESYLAIGDKKLALNEYNILKSKDIDLANEVVDKLGDRLFEKNFREQPDDKIDFIKDDSLKINHGGFMSIFNKKAPVSVEDFCSDLYEEYIFKPVLKVSYYDVDIYEVYVDELKKVDPLFSLVDKQMLIDELITIRLELFALVWVHKFVSDKIIIVQSVFTKQYLENKGRKDIWIKMQPYSNMIYSATLNWITSLGKMKMAFNHSLLKGLESKNIKFAKELGFDVEDDSILRVNLRTLSEEAWRKRLTLSGIAGTFCKQLKIDRNDVTKYTGPYLASIFTIFYNEDKKFLDMVRIIRS